MYAIEFEADVKNRRIEIPRYEKFEFRHVKVVLMSETERLGEESSKLKSCKFSAPFLKTRNFKFDRQEANAR